MPPPVGVAGEVLDESDGDATSDRDNEVQESNNTTSSGTINISSSIFEDEDNDNTYIASPPTYKHIYLPPYQPYLNQGRDVSVAIKPVYGAHRPDQDVVMTAAMGYELPHIIYFVTSLLETGYEGDIVVGMGPDISNATREILIRYSKHHSVVTYEIPLQWCCPRNWVRNIYNQTILDEIGELPRICSVTTFGGQPAMEMYNRAMVKEFDDTSTAIRTGMDQGRHIVLVLRNKLVEAPNIEQ